MSGIVAGALVAHPPILLPEVGGSESQRVSASAAALRRLDQQLAEQAATHILMVSPHSPSSPDRIPVRRGTWARGDLSRFRAPQVGVEVRVDHEASAALVRAAGDAGFPLSWTDDPELDHGLVVPLHFLERTREDKLFTFLGISGWPLQRFVEFGGWLQGHLIARSTLVIASGDLSHRLIPSAPAGFRPQGRVFDELVVGALRDRDWQRIETLDPNFIEDAGECGLRPLAILLGAARAAGLESTVLSYEGPFGVGYPVVGFTRSDPPAGGLDLQSLGRSAIEHYLRHREFIEPPEPVPPELLLPSAVFVTLRKRGELRGCVGSLYPTEASAAHEFIRYAVASALRDPRFEPVRPDEVAELSVTLQLLDPPEAVSSVADLDPARYGLIVRSGDRQGLLLPGIDQIATAEEQLAAACAKAGIGPFAPVQMLRFRTRTIG
jgi:AmmeMemoRadiSam system protein A